ncbi:MAG: hypothetical protein JKX72_09255 [Robiginitomaculum sp.]|nr:hypothetical protein [Robiginitomaculum sp.]
MVLDGFSASLRSKLSGPVFFPFVFSAAAVNWKALFLLFVSDGSAQERIILFEANSTPCTLLFLPALSAFALILGLAYLKWGLGLLTAPATQGKRMRDSRTDEAVENSRLNHQVNTAKLRVEIAERNKFAGEITETIENADLKKVTEEALSTNTNNQAPSTKRPSAIDGYTWLQNQTLESLDGAERVAFNDAKPLLIVIYDERAMSNGHIRHAAKYFFEFQETRDLVDSNFVVYLAERTKVHNLLSSLTVSIERPAFILRAFDKRVIDQGRLSGNPDTGLNTVKKWLAMLDN